MSFPRYPKYKPSGVEWLGDVPEHWEAKPLRSIFSFSKGLTITKEHLQDAGISCVNYGEIHSKYGFRLDPTIHSLRCVATEYLSSDPDALIRDGDFVFADTSEDLEGSGNFTHLRSDTSIFAGYHTIIGRPRKGVFPLFLAFQLQSPALRSQIQSQVKGIKVFSISQAILKSVKCWLPPDDEQSAIAGFLDRETGKIDSLVAEQRRLIELLKEKRQSVISHAVTKGLNPHAPLRASGIQWLGDVPEHWSTKKLFYLLSEPPKNGISPEITTEGTTPTFSIAAVRDGKVNIHDHLKFTSLSSEDAAAYLVHQDDVLVLRGSGSKELVGSAGIVIVPPPLGCIYPDILIRIRPASTVLPWYLVALLNSDYVRPQIVIAAQTAAGIWKISGGALREIDLPCPPLSEQELIEQFVQERTVELDALTAEAERAIELLQERRTALISAAVTGKIDVRGLVPS